MGMQLLQSKKAGETVTRRFSFGFQFTPSDSTSGTVSASSSIWSGTGSALTLTPVTSLSSDYWGSVTVAGGTAGCIYKILCIFTASDSKVYQMAGYLAVVDDVI